MKGTRTVVLMFFVALIAITWFDIKRNQLAPPPSAYLGATGLYGAFALLSEVAPGFAGLLSVAWTVGLLFYIGNPTNAKKLLSQSQTQLGMGSKNSLSDVTNQ